MSKCKSIFGTWQFVGHNCSGDVATVITLQMWSSGNYLISNIEEVDDCGRAGIETGIFTYNPESGLFKVTQVIRDDNGEWGLSHIPEDTRFIVSEDGKELQTWEKGQRGITLKRL